MPKPQPKPKRRRPSAATPPALTPKSAAPTAALAIPSCRGEVWVRVVLIHAMINRGERFTAVDLVARLEIDIRTVERTIEFMRDRLEMPIEFDRPLNSYRFTRPYPYLPTTRIDPDEAFALKFLSQVTPAFAGAPARDALVRVLQKLSLLAGGSNAFADGPAKAVLFPFAAPDAEESRFLQLVSEAMDAQEAIAVDYQNADATHPTTRIVHPLDLAYFHQRWVVLVHDTLRHKPRTLRLDRLHGARRTGTRFARPTDYDPSELLSGNIGAYTGREHHEIRLLLSDHAALDARTRPWHKSQTNVEHPAGRLEIALALNNLVDITHQVLYWGPQIEVLAPPALRTRVRDALVAALAKYPA